MTRTTTRSPRRTRAMIFAFTCALALSVPAVSAQAESADPGVRCAASTGPGQYEFFLPGERAVDKDGNKWVCGPDGKWFRDYSSIYVPPTTTRPPLVRAAL